MAQKREKREPRTSIAVQGARVHNLRNISVEIPRDTLVVITGLSGSGKSSLAFDTIYAEGQRRYMESLSSYAKRFVAQVAKPDVDFIFGLSPVISIEQKTLVNNPRSTVGTMTDIASYLNLLFATIGQPHCPRSGEPVPSRSASQILEAILALPEGTEVELRAPVFKIYGEDLDVVFTETRKKGVRWLVIDGTPVDLAAGIESLDLDEAAVHHMDAVVDRLIVAPAHEKAIKAAISATLLVGDGLMRVQVGKGASRAEADRFYKGLVSPTHHFVYGDIGPEFFMFNNPESACRTCGGLGVDKVTHPELLIPDPKRSILGGCFVREAFKYNPDTWDGRVMYSLSRALDFALDAPWRQLSEKVRKALLYGIDTKIPVLTPPDGKVRLAGQEGKTVGFAGIARRIERWYRRYRQRGEANSKMEAWLDKVMVEHTCPDCSGTRVRHTRLLFTIGGRTLHDVGQLNFDELQTFLAGVKISGRGADAGRQVLGEIRARLTLLLGIGLDYLNFNRRSGTLSGGESQRIRLSTQIGSGLMGMLYVLDEPSIGLHPKDNTKMIATLESLRDIGNTVIVVEHDEDTIRAADHVVEMGPGPGVHGGQVVAQGTLADILACKASPTGQFFSGRRSIAVPSRRRKGTGQSLVVRGARENNLKDVTVEIPLGVLVAVTGASGSGKSTLVNDILFKALWKKLEDTRTLPGQHDGVDGLEHVHKVVNIDQSPIGRNSRSNPATYVGFYDTIRDLFTNAPLSIEREYKPGRFSFNVKGGRCEECQGEGVITTQLYFMPDVEVICGVCKGARFNAETLEVTVRGKTIADILNMSIEEGATFFASEPALARKLEVLNELGLGYLTLGQSSTTLSGGEAQRIKIATELSKLQRSRHTVYILDEPTTGLHLADVERLLASLNQLVDAGHTVLLIEHHMDVIKTADHVIDLGPEGGHAGGKVLVTGTPEVIARSKTSHTGRFLKPYLRAVRLIGPPSAQITRPRRHRYPPSPDLHFERVPAALVDAFCGVHEQIPAPELLHNLQERTSKFRTAVRLEHFAAGLLGERLEQRLVQASRHAFHRCLDARMEVDPIPGNRVAPAQRHSVDDAVVAMRDVDDRCAREPAAGIHTIGEDQHERAAKPRVPQRQRAVGRIVEQRAARGLRPGDGGFQRRLACRPSTKMNGVGEGQQRRPIGRLHHLHECRRGVPEVDDALARETAAGVEREHEAERHVFDRHRFDALHDAAVLQFEVGRRETGNRPVAVHHEHIGMHGLGARAKRLLTATRRHPPRARASRRAHPGASRLSHLRTQHRQPISYRIGRVAQIAPQRLPDAGRGACESQFQNLPRLGSAPLLLEDVAERDVCSLREREALCRRAIPLFGAGKIAPSFQQPPEEHVRQIRGVVVRARALDIGQHAHRRAVIELQRSDAADMHLQQRGGEVVARGLPEPVGRLAERVLPQSCPLIHGSAAGVEALARLRCDQALARGRHLFGQQTTLVEAHRVIGEKLAAEIENLLRGAAIAGIAKVPGQRDDPCFAERTQLIVGALVADREPSSRQIELRIDSVVLVRRRRRRAELQRCVGMEHDREAEAVGIPCALGMTSTDQVHDLQHGGPFQPEHIVHARVALFVTGDEGLVVVGVGLAVVRV